MRDMLEIGPVPADEECAQVGDDGYYHVAMAECLRFIDLIKQKLGPEPKGARLFVHRYPHELGAYLEVAVAFDTSIEESIEYAFRVEREAPTNWSST